MRSVTGVALLGFVVCAHAKELLANETHDAQDAVDKWVDNLIDKMFDHAYAVAPHHHADLDNTVLEKPGHTVNTPGTNPRPFHLLHSRSPLASLHVHHAPCDSASPKDSYKPHSCREALGGMVRSLSLRVLRDPRVMGASWRGAVGGYSSGCRERAISAAVEASGVSESPKRVSVGECELVVRAASLALRARGRVSPHPWAGCVLATAEMGEDEPGEAIGWDQPGDVHQVLAEAWQEGQGGRTCEELAVQAAKTSQVRQGKRGITAFLNLEPSHGNAAGTTAAVDALVAIGVKRVIIGIALPLPGLRMSAVEALKAQGVDVHVLEEEDDGEGGAYADARARAIGSCRMVNRALLHRAAFGLPFSIFKYAMTLDGKIATDQGDSAWVSGPESRRLVHQFRSHSDCVIVGGNTARLDNPRLTTRSYGHQPTRVILSKSLDLPLEANIWNVDVAPTLVFTQTNASQKMKKYLKARGVQVVEFETLTPRAAMEYCYALGFLQCFWECGGTLAAPALLDGVIHRAMAFVAPKLIGSTSNMSPIGNLHKPKMDMAVELVKPEYSTIANDLLVQGYVPPSKGLSEVAKQAAATAESAVSSACLPGRPPVASNARELRFYKAWDTFGALSNFARLPIRLPILSDSQNQEWATVEHFYQAHKFNMSTEEGRAAVYEVKAQLLPESAAKLGREAQRAGRKCLRSDWNAIKKTVMWKALQAKFERHQAARELLLASGDRILIEDSPHDTVWGIGWNHSGDNLLGRLLMELRAGFRNESFTGHILTGSLERVDEPCGEHDCNLALSMSTSMSQQPDVVLQKGQS